MKKVLFFTMLLFAIVFHAQVTKNYTFRSKEEIKTFSDDVMNSFANNNFKNAYAILRMKWILPENELDQLEGLTFKQMNTVGDRYGKIMSYEFYKDSIINESLLRKIYILKLENIPIVFQFTFYNNGKGWVFNNFQFSDTVDIFQL